MIVDPFVLRRGERADDARGDLIEGELLRDGT
jgi:hypothetical protein